MATSVQLRQKKAKLVADIRKITDRAATENRSISTEERAEMDKMFLAIEGRKDADTGEILVRGIDQEIEAAEKDESRLAGLEKELAKSQGLQTRPEIGAVIDSPKDKKSWRASDEYRSAWNKWLTASDKWEETQAMSECRALQVDASTAGGYLVAPEQFMNELIIFVNNYVFMRQLSTVMQVKNADSLGVPSLDTDPADSDWTSELNTGTEDSSMAFGKRALIPHPLAKRIKVSNKLLRLSTDAERIVRERLAYKFAVTQEKAFLLGTGTNQPLGIFVASNAGVPTGQDVSTGNSTTQVLADNLFNVKYSLKQQHQDKGVWLFNRTVVRDIMKLKDGVGNYLWRQGLQAGAPDEILGRPVYMSEYAPNTMTTGLYVGAFFNPQYYYIADSVNFELQRLMELYAESAQTGFIGRIETDGMPVLSEAFARVTLA